MSDPNDVVTEFLDWAVHERDYLRKVPTEDPDKILELIPEFLEHRNTNPDTRAQATRVLAKKLRAYRQHVAAIKQPRTVEEVGFSELMRRAALGEAVEEPVDE